MGNAVGHAVKLNPVVGSRRSKRATRAAAVALAVGVVIAGALPTQPVLAVGSDCDEDWAGAGTAADPFLIATADDLRALSETDESDCWTYEFLQTADIDLGSDPFEPIAFDRSPGFTGVYDGGGHTISGLLIDSGDDRLGLFSRLDGATVTDLVIEGEIDIDDQESIGSVGGLAGEAQNSDVTAVTSRVDISLTYDDDDAEITTVGGVVGAARAHTNLNGVVWHGTITIDVFEPEDPISEVGGIAGRLLESSIDDSSASGTITASTPTSSGFTVCGIGGAVGDVDVDSTIARTASSVSLTITTHDTCRIGGFVGQLSEGASIADAYAVGPITLDVDGFGDVGGFVGDVSDASIARAYAAGAIHAAEEAADGPVGGFVGGSDDLTLDAVFYEQGVLPDSVTSSDQHGATEASSGQMRTAATFVDEGWDFTSVWGMTSGLNDGLPVLCVHHGGTSGSSPCAPSSSSGSSRSSNGTDGPVEDPDGTLPHPGPGVATVNVDGQSHEVAIVALDGATIVIEFDGIRIELTVVDDNGRPVGLDGDTLVLDGQRRLRVIATGFAQWTDLEIWLFSTPALVDTARSNIDGDVHTMIRGFDSSVGRHTLQLVGTDGDDRQVAVALGVQVGHEPSTLAFTGPAVDRRTSVAVLAGILALLVGSSLVRRTSGARMR